MPGDHKKTLKSRLGDIANTLRGKMGADEFCPLSRSRFHTLFKQATRMTCISYLKKRRIEEAKKLLLSTDRQAGEIAQEVGSNSPTYFSNVFRQETGPLQETCLTDVGICSELY